MHPGGALVARHVACHRAQRPVNRVGAIPCLHPACILLTQANHIILRSALDLSTPTWAIVCSVARVVVRANLGSAVNRVESGCVPRLPKDPICSDIVGLAIFTFVLVAASENQRTGRCVRIMQVVCPRRVVTTDTIRASRTSRRELECCATLLYDPAAACVRPNHTVISIPSQHAVLRHVSSSVVHFVEGICRVLDLQIHIVCLCVC
mmetsp:Transcript_31126/g.74520  ORF Transcript_31126/g.74520 Transcript_31126/m.74520 type:complete len:207 (-) Transcript_31126:141-761(-)